MSRALGEVLPALEALEVKKMQRGRDFGELVRERRRLRGLPLPVAEKVLPFRSSLSAVTDQKLPEVSKLPAKWPSRDAEGGAEEEVYLRAQLAEYRMAEAWMRLEEAERQGVARRRLHALEVAYLQEVCTYEAACRLVFPGIQA